MNADTKFEKFLISILNESNGSLINELRDRWEAFKASSPSGGRDWEIVSFEKDDGILVFSKGGYRNSLNSISLESCLQFKLPINAVKRLSDGEVFTCKQDAKHPNFTIPLMITGFKIEGNKMMVQFHPAVEVVLSQVQPASPASIEPEQIIKPPIGIIPEWLWKEQRKKELREVIKRYCEAKNPVPLNWIAEEYCLTEWLEMYHEDQQAQQKINNPS